MRRDIAPRRARNRPSHVIGGGHTISNVRARRDASSCAISPRDGRSAMFAFDGTYMNHVFTRRENRKKTQ